MAELAGLSMEVELDDAVPGVGLHSALLVSDAVAQALEQALDKPAIKRMLPMQAGDMHATWADSEPLHTLTGTRPATPLRQGVAEFVRWYLDYYRPG